ncbi:MAG: hypothetical protein V7670_17315 [Maribacter arcticus]|uniref:hypothetical protein n=1 Tax=Maribacter arcticus TaxID=561365 RepID=UPI003002DE8B
MKLQFFIICLFSTLLYSQNELSGIVVDISDNSPLEFVGIYNKSDHTMTNADGRFQFYSTSDSIIIYRPGYDKISTTFQKTNDTIYLNKSVLELNEVTVTIEKTLWQKVKDSIDSNYPLYPYKEKFLLRGVLRYNGEITRIQDLQGKLERRTLLYTHEIEPDKKDFKVELTNMRKVGLVLDENDIYFIFDSFYDLFMNLIPVNATGDAFDLIESTFENGSKINLSFQTKPEFANEKVTGHYIINAKNNAIEQFKIVFEFENNPFSENEDSRYRTISIDKEISLSKSRKNQKYYIESSKYHVVIEQTDENNSYTSYYDVSFILTTSDNEGDFDVKKNVSTSKDLFKINYPYDQSFWNTQNQLLLTEEMLDFIEKVQDPNNEFKVRSNIKN